MSPKELVELGKAFDTLHGLVMSRVFPHMVWFLRGQEVSFVHLTAMFQVLFNGSQSIADIATGVNLTQNAASRMVDRLVRAGYLHRAEDPDDRRQKLVTLTDSGEAVLNELPAITIASYAEVLADVPAELLDRVGAVMKEVAAAVPARPVPPSRQTGRAARESRLAHKTAGAAGKKQAR